MKAIKQINIGTKEAPLFVPEGSPGHQEYIKTNPAQTPTTPETFGVIPNVLPSNINDGGIAQNTGLPSIKKNEPEKTGPISTGIVNKLSPTEPTTPSPGDDSIWQYEELSPEMRAQLDTDPLAREQFDLIAKQGGQTIQETVQKTLQTLAEIRKQKDFNEDQARISLERQNIVNKAGERQLLQGVSDAKSNTYYSALSSAPSMVANTAAGARIKEMATQFDEFVKLNSLQGEAYTKQVAENARRIQDDLNDKLGKALAESLQNIDRSIADGTILTEAQLMKVYKDNKDAMLKAFPALTNFAVQQMSDLTTNFMNTQKEMRQAKVQFDALSNTLNEEMSMAQGFYVNGNGHPILDAKGQKIATPEKTWMNPQMSKDGTALLIGAYDDFGNEIIKKVATGMQPEKKKRNIIETPQGLYDVDNDKWIQSPGTQPQGPTSTVPYMPPTGFESRGAGQSVPVKNTGDGIEIGIQSGTKLEGVGGQCGGLVNDFASSIPGYKKVGDTFESKLANKNSMQPVAGGLVMWTPGRFEDNGHIGIVEKVFADGSFQIYDTNYVAANTTSRRVIKPGDKEYDLIQKTGGFFDPSKIGVQTGKTEYSDTDIRVFNSLTASEKSKRQNDPTFRKFVEDYNKVMKDKNASLEEILMYSDGHPKLGDKEGERLIKFDQALSQVTDLSSQISKMKTGPILGTLRKLNPYDTPAQTLKAQLQSLIPNLARGVYGEVGVLTDQDIANYAKTIPNLQSTNDVNDAILAMTLKVLGEGYKKQLQSFAAAKNDVSGFEGTYYQFMDRVKEIEDRLGITGTQQSMSIDSTTNNNPYGI